MKLYIDFSTKKDKLRLFEYMKGLKGKHWVTIDRETRSQSQNKYYWAVVVQIIANETGMDKKEVHRELTERFLPRFFRDRHRRKEVMEGGRTSELTVEKFKDYTDMCVAFAGIELNIYIPDPNEVMDI